MSDNITIRDYDGNPVVVRADDVSSVFWQYLKVAFGTDNAATVVDATHPLPVTEAKSALTLITTKAALIASQAGLAVLTPASGYKVNLLRIVINCTTAGIVHLFKGTTDNAVSSIGPDYDLVANQTVELEWPVEWPHPAATNEPLKYTTDTFVGSIYVEWYEIL